MAAKIRNCLGVDIGSQWLRVAHLELSKSGPRVLALLERQLEVSATMNEAQRYQAIAKQLLDLLKSNKIRTNKAVFSVPGQTVFVRQFPLPKSTPDRMKRMVGFEARQRVPFPLDKTIMEFQIFEGEQPTEVNVLLVAIKREFIVNFMRLVRRTGLNPLAISVSSVALYNFHELNTSTRDLTGDGKKKADKAQKLKPTTAEKKKTKGLKGLFGRKKDQGEAAEPEELPEGLEALDEQAPLEEMGFEEIQAYVNLGASLMDLAIPKPGSSRMIGFTRSVPLAGNEMDRLINEKLGLENPDRARQIKEREAVVLATDFEIDGDPSKVNMEASEAATAIADRIISELRRSLDYYISQPDGVAVDNIVLSGGLARLRFLSSYIEEKMGVPVTLAEPHNEQLRMPDNAPDPFAPFAQAVGLGIQGLGIAQNRINFLPEEIKNLRGLESRRFELAGMVAMLLAIIGLSWDTGSGRVAAYRNEIRQIDSEMVLSRQESQEIQKVLTQNQKVTQAYEELAKAGGNQDFWFGFLKKFTEHRPPEILIDQMICRLDGNVIVRGRSPTLSSLNQFLDELKVMTKGELPVTAENPEGLLPVSYNNYYEMYDVRYGKVVQFFEITIKTYERLGRIKLIGRGPTGMRMESTPLPGIAPSRPAG